MHQKGSLTRDPTRPAKIALNLTHNPTRPDPIRLTQTPDPCLSLIYLLKFTDIFVTLILKHCFQRRLNLVNFFRIRYCEGRAFFLIIKLTVLTACMR